MYIVLLKAGVVEAMRVTFGSDYLIDDFKGVNVSQAYPIAEQEYPAVWVDYSDTAPLTRAGIAHLETGFGDEGEVDQFSRWRFAGVVSFTCVAMSSLECDRLFDEVVRVFAFGAAAPSTNRFRTIIESNDFVAMNFNFDTLDPKPPVAAPGTPWGSDEMIYERGIEANLIGEFITDRQTGSLALLSGFTVEGTEVVGGDFGPPDREDGFI